MKKLKEIFISILIPNLFGVFGSIIGNAKSFKDMIKPNFAPPAIVFPIVWGILYTIMGISSYIIYKSDNANKEKAFLFYIIQLFVNSLWTFFFFALKWYLFAFIWLLLLIILVIIMIIEFHKINKVAAYLQVPYLFWLIFASILNYSIYSLNVVG